MYVSSTRLQPAKMRGAALELGTSESVFLFRSETARYEICAYDKAGRTCDPAGTAAMAAGHVLFTEGHAGRTQGLAFDSPTGSFRVERRADHTTLIVLPRRAEEAKTSPASLESLSASPALTNGVDLIVPLADERAVRDLDAHSLNCSEWPGERFTFTAPSASQLRDFVTRTFTKEGDRCSETCVSGAAYQALGPYWLERLKSPILRSEHLDARGGVVHIEATSGATLAVSGQCVSTVKGIFVVVP